MSTALRKQWLLLPTGLCVLGACLSGICWYLYGYDHIVVYPVVTIYDYTDAGGNPPHAWAAVLLFLLLGACLFCCWMRTRGLARPSRRSLLAGAVVCLLMSGLVAIWLPNFWFIHLQQGGYSGLDQRHGSVSYWHLRYSADLETIHFESFQCDDRLWLCHLSASEPYTP
jgi:hypothetical protein